MSLSSGRGRTWWWSVLVGAMVMVVPQTGLAQPPSPPIALVQQAGLDAGATAAATLAFPSANTLGNWIAVGVRAGALNETFTITDTAGNLYQKAAQFNVTLDGVSLAIFYAENIKSGTNTVRVAASQSATLRFAVLEYSGVATANSLDVTASAQGTSTAPTTGPLTTTSNGDLLLGAIMTANPATVTAGSGYTRRVSVPANPSSKFAVEDLVQTTVGSAAVTASLGASSPWGVVAAAFKPLGAPGSPSPSSGATGVSTTLTATWTAAGANGPTGFDVYFGLTNPPPYFNTTTNRSFSPQCDDFAGCIFPPLAKSTTYFWKIVTISVAGRTAGPVWSFTTAAFDAPSAPAPTNGASGVSLTPTLTWTAAGATSYDVYFGGLNPPLVVSNASSPTYSPAPLLAGTTYFWRVVSRSGGLTAAGPLWSFTTAASSLPGVPVSPIPANGTVGVGTTPTLAWNATGATNYFVRFGSSNPPPGVPGNFANSYTPPPLAHGATYFWQVIASNDAGTTSGPVWNFTTAQQSASEDGFNPGANGPILAMVIQPDGKIVVGGSFTTLGGGGTGGTPRNNIGRLNVDGSVDASFNPGANAAVYTLAAQGDGKILVGGTFTGLGGGTGAMARNRIGRLNSDGSVDPSFNPGANGVVNVVLLQPDGEILVGGTFTGLGGGSGATPRNAIGRLNADGSVDMSFNPGANSAVYALALQPDGKFVVGGAFTGLGGGTGTTARSRVGRLNADGTVDLGFNPGASDPVFALVLQPDGRMLVGGRFTALGGGGSGTVLRHNIGRLNVDGSVDATFDPGANADVLAIALQADGKILVGGAFTTLGGGGSGTVPRARIGRLTADGSLDAGFDPGARNVPDAPSGAYVQVLAVRPDGSILAGGFFSGLGGGAGTTLRNYIGRLNADGSVDADLVGGANRSIYAVAVQPDGKVLVGGVFTTLGDGGPGTTPRNYLGRFNVDGSLDTSFNPGANDTVNALAVQPDGKILVGGFFTTLGGGGTGTTSRNYLGRLNADGSVDASFNPGASNSVIAITMQPDGKILLGGNFTRLGGGSGTITRNGIGRLNPDGSVDLGFNPGVSAYALALQPDGKILVGGFFSAIGGGTGTTPRQNIARLNADGSPDASFDPGTDNTVQTLLVQPDGKILVGGFFSTLGGGGSGTTARQNIGRLHLDGTLDASFDPGSNGAALALAMQPDGKILIGGSFTTLGGGGTGTTPRNNIGRLNADGTIDSGFDPGADAGVRALVGQVDGKILVGGDFTMMGGGGAGTAPRRFLARLANTDAAIQHLSVMRGGGAMTWLRSGAGPEFWRTTFEVSADGVAYALAGTGTRVPGGWQLSGLNLSPLQSVYVRTRGYYGTGGYSGNGGSIAESIWNVYVAGTPTVSLSSASLSFGSQTLGTTSAPQTVTVTNTGTAPLNSAGLGVSGEFTQNNTCGPPVPVGGSCTFTLRFEPTVIGPQTGNLTLFNDGLDSPQVITLTGTGAASPSVSLSSTSLSFGNQERGTTSVPQSVTVTNTGTAPLTISGLTASAQFTQSNTCAAPVPAGGTCTLAIRFAPTAFGPQTGNITLFDDAADSPQVINLAGTGFHTPVPPEPAIALVQQTSSNPGTTTVATLAFPAPNTLRHWIAVAVRASALNEVFTITDTAGNLYQQAVQFNGTAAGASLAIFYAENIKSGANTVRVAVSQSAALRIAILEYSGVATANSLDVTAAAQGTSTTPNSGPLTTTSNGELLLGAIMTANPATVTAGSGYTRRATVPANPNARLAVEDLVQTAAGAAAATASLGASNPWGVVVAAFKPMSAPGSPSPANGATGVSTRPELTWSAAGGDGVFIPGFDVYFGTTNPPAYIESDSALSDRRFFPACDPFLGCAANNVPPLMRSTTYFWQILSLNSLGSTAGPVWHFTTAGLDAPSSPSPANFASSVSTATSMTWTAAGATSFDVRFGTSNPPPVVASNLASPVYTPTLAVGTSYFWQIVGHAGAETATSPVWSFTTAASPLPDAPGSPSPLNGEVGVSTTPVLSWTAAGAISYDVRFGTTNPPPSRATTSTPTYTPNCQDLVECFDTGTTYFWQIIAINTAGTTPGPVWSFTTAAVGTPFFPRPSDGATGVSPVPDMRWSVGSLQSGDTWDIRLGTTNPPPLVRGNWTSLQYNPTLANGTTYYWQIVSHRGADSVIGPLWSFATRPFPGPPGAPTPANGAVGVTITPSLTWTGAAPCLCPVSYQVYFGASNPPPFVVSAVSPSYAPTTLASNTTYFWQIVAFSGDDRITGPLWSFTTGASAFPSVPSLPIPSNTALDVSTATSLAWTAAGATVYDVRFGTSNPPPSRASTSIPTYTPDCENLGECFAPSTTYFWQVIASNAAGSTDGPVWSFTTAVVGTPYFPRPSNGAQNVFASELSLRWSQPGAIPGSTAYDVRFGTSNPPPVVRSNSTDSMTEYFPGTLDNDTTYFWQIVAHYGGGTAAGPVWSFKVRPFPGLPRSPTPSSGATGVAATPSLTWSAADACLCYTGNDVFFGTGNPPPFAATVYPGSTYSPGTLAPLTTYFWRIIAHHGDEVATGPLWSFTTGAFPETPGLPTPANGAVGVTNAVFLTWASAGATAYEIRFGAANPPPLVVSNALSAAYVPPLPLSHNTTYFWQIVAGNAAGSTTGPVWSFTTAPLAAASSPVPSNGAVGVSPFPDMRWTVGDIAGGDTWDVRLGTSNPPPLAKSNSPSPQYTPTLAPGTAYFWQIVSHDVAGNVATGPVWSFTTRPLPDVPSAPTPSNGAVGVSTTPVLTWTDANATEYQVFFGTTNPPPATSSGLSPTYIPPLLAAGTTYFWQIVGRNSGGTATGPVWSFTTAAQSVPVTLVQQAGLDAGTTASATVAFQSANVSGHWLAVAVRAGALNQVFTVTDTNGNLYRKAAQLNVTIDGSTLALYYAEDIRGGANTIRVTATQSATLRLAILEYAGVAASNSLFLSAVAQGTSAAPSSPTLDRPSAGDLVLGAIMTGNPATITQGSGYTRRVLVPANPNAKLAVEDLISPTATPTAATAALGASGPWAVVAAVFKAAQP